MSTVDVRSIPEFTSASDQELPNVLCCMCGAVMPSNPTNMCVACIKSHVDITQGLPRDCTISYCKYCERYLQPPKYWVRCALESKELMQLCLKRLKGLHKVRLVDATFLFTEAHSKRIQLKLIIQKELFKGAVIQQSFVVEYVIHWQQCEACQKIATGQPQWDAVVQLRQKVSHRRTFLYLEQLILKNKMHSDATRIQAQPDGLDFFFGHRSHGMKFLDFVSGVVPLIRKDSQQLVSSDCKSNIAEIHHTFSAEIAPICREDLVCLPKKISTSMGGLGPLVLCHKVFSSIVFLDPLTLRVGEMLGTLYWKMPFLSVASVKEMTEFYVIDVRLVPGLTNGKFQIADVTVCVASEVGQGREFMTRTHLGNVLQEGDGAMGYLLPSLNVNHDDFSRVYESSRGLPDVLLVRKHYEAQKGRRRRRKWKLAQLPKEVSATGGNVRRGDARQQDDDMEEFMDDLERDAELRAGVALYANAEAAGAETDHEGEEDVPRVPQGEILPEEGPSKGGEDPTHSEGDDEDWEDEDEDGKGHNTAE